MKSLTHSVHIVFHRLLDILFTRSESKLLGEPGAGCTLVHKPTTASTILYIQINIRETIRNYEMHH